MIGELLPTDIGGGAAVLLIAVSFMTSALTAAVGLGGGVALMAFMASIIPISALIPVHGVVQVGSNIGRAVVRRQNIDWRIFAYFAVGSLFGAWLGGNVVVALPGHWLSIALGLFVLFSVWGPKPRFAATSNTLIGAAGFTATFLTMFFGATGILVGSIISARSAGRLAFIANHAVCMTLQHGLKIVVFGLLGFAYGPWLPLIAAMIVSGFAGTLSGNLFLERLPERTFKKVFRLVITALAVRLIVMALADLA